MNGCTYNQKWLYVGSIRFQLVADSPQSPIVEKIRTIAQRVYGAADIELSAEAKDKIEYYNEQVRSAETCMRLPPSLTCTLTLTRTPLSSSSHAGLRLAAHLHGQDPPVSVPHARQEGSAERVRPAHPRRPRQRRGRIHLPAGGDGGYSWSSKNASETRHYDTTRMHILHIYTLSVFFFP